MTESERNDIAAMYPLGDLNPILREKFIAHLEKFLHMHHRELRSLSSRDKNGIRHRHFTISHVSRKHPGIIAGAVEPNEMDGHRYPVVRLDDNNEVVKKLPREYQFRYTKEKEGQKTSNVCIIICSETIDLIPALLEGQLKWFKSYVLSQEETADELMANEALEQHDVEAVLEIATPVWDNGIGATGENIELSTNTEPVSKREVTTYQHNRESKYADQIKKLYRYRCQICGTVVESEDGDRYAEAHHVKPLAAGGFDLVDNMVCVCPNCHVKLHLGFIDYDLNSLNMHTSHSIAEDNFLFHKTHLFNSHKKK
jgi:hypothetical protein